MSEWYYNWNDLVIKNTKFELNDCKINGEIDIDLFIQDLLHKECFVNPYINLEKSLKLLSVSLIPKQLRCLCVLIIYKSLSKKPFIKLKTALLYIDLNVNITNDKILKTYISIITGDEYTKHTTFPSNNKFVPTIDSKSIFNEIHMKHYDPVYEYLNKNCVVTGGKIFKNVYGIKETANSDIDLVCNVENTINLISGFVFESSRKKEGEINISYKIILDHEKRYVYPTSGYTLEITNHTENKKSNYDLMIADEAFSDNVENVINQFDLGMCEIYYNGNDVLCSFRHLAVLMTGIDVYRFRHTADDQFLHVQQRIDKYSKYATIIIAEDIPEPHKWNMNKQELSLTHFLGAITFGNIIQSIELINLNKAKTRLKFMFKDDIEEDVDLV